MFKMNQNATMLIGIMIGMVVFLLTVLFVYHPDGTCTHNGMAVSCGGLNK